VQTPEEITMPDSENQRLTRWPLRVALSALLVVELFLVVRLSAEGVADNILMILNSVGLVVFAVLVWRGVPRSRLFLVTLLAWRVASIGYNVVLHISPSDHRFLGTLLIAGFYVALGLLVASPLGRSHISGAA
jgi:hypothetical protein